MHDVGRRSCILGCPFILTLAVAAAPVLTLINTSHTITTILPSPEHIILRPIKPVAR